MVGSGKGSWQIRGEQVGTAIGARTVGAPSDDDLRWADVVVLVKRAGAAWAALAQRFKKPIVWDALDFWAQPSDNHATPEVAQALVRAWIAAIRPALVLGATEAMAQACGGEYVPHHSRPGLTATPARETVATVAYEGNALYLGRWRQRLEAECAQRGWQFVINPTYLGQADLIVALRDGVWDGWICRQWKSGVKLVNAMAAGRPVITQLTAAFSELQPVGTAIEDAHGLRLALDTWADRRLREQAVTQPGARMFHVEQIAARYRALLASVGTPCTTI